MPLGSGGAGSIANTEVPGHLYVDTELAGGANQAAGAAFIVTVSSLGHYYVDVQSDNLSVRTEGGTGVFATDNAGNLIQARAAVPADAALLASHFALWLDASPGATKLMIKAKDSGGTVRTAAINLA